MLGSYRTIECGNEGFPTIGRKREVPLVREDIFGSGASALQNKFAHGEVLPGRGCFEQALF